MTEYIDCTYCANWSIEQKRGQTCRVCNNSGKATDPKLHICNKCGECTRHLGTYNETYPSGLENAEVQGGYESYHLFDCTTYTFSLCEKCLRELFNSCKVPPIVQDNTADGEWNYQDDRKAYDYRVWKDGGGHHQAYLDKKCNAEKDCPNKAIYTRLHNKDFTEDCTCEEHKGLWNYSNSSLTKFIPNVLKPFL